MRGQVIQGTLVEAESGEGLEGAFVLLLDGGEQVGAWLTDADGVFVLRAPGPGRFLMRVERIGYATVEDTLPALAVGDTLERRVVVRPAPIALPSINVEGEPVCILRPDVAEPTRVLWEEARKALEIAVWAERQQRFRYDVVLYRRTLERRELAVLREDREYRSGLRERPFSSTGADTLVTQGFIRPEDDHLVYDGPDGRLLLSDAFLDTHCFHVAASPGAGLAALAFQPVRGRELPDIRGTIALDAATARLRWIRFHYTGANLPRAADPEDYGGVAEFQRLPSGAWIVSHWRFRFPGLRTRSRHARIEDPGAWRTARVTAYQETEGAVTRIVTPDGAALDADVEWGTVTGTVVTRDGEPVENAVVVLAGTPHAALTDGFGDVWLERIPEGRYTVTVEHPRLRGRAPEQVVATVPGDTVSAGALVIRLRR